MEFGPKRGHFLYIFDSFFKDFSLLIITMSFGLITGNMDLILDNMGILIIVLIQPISKIAAYITTYYSIDNDRLFIKSGFFKKNESEIPLSTITTIDLSQNLLQQIFDVYKLNADNTSNISGTNTKINMTLKKDDALRVRNLLTKSKSNLDFTVETHSFDNANIAIDNSSDSSPNCNIVNDITEKRIIVPSSDLMLLGLMKSKGIFMIQLITIISAAFAMFNLSSIDFIVEYSQRGIFFFGLGLFLLILLALLFIVAMLCGLVGSLIKYYGFEVLDTGNALRITYGLLTKKHYTIQKSKISGFAYEQSLFMRLMHTGSLQLFAIGYGNSDDEETTEEPMFLPLVKEDYLRAIISDILPEMEVITPYHRPKRGTLHYFFYGFGFIFALIILIISIASSLILGHHLDKVPLENLWMIGLLPILYSILGRIQEYRHSAISENDKNISIISGGFNQTTVFIKTTHVESISSKSSIQKLKKNIGHISINYIAPLGSSMKTAKNISLDVFESLKSKLLY